MKDELIASQTYVTSGFEGLMDSNETGSVLASKQSKLVSVIILESKD